ncbi:FAD:protein FMN transferase [Candidatus Uabimicrobium amorphum]|uniref:FAD:protein FMN transferase n=1 Tax=Uabimicrobium amorphum TaxID=2596890 RepID=A0A5S9IQ66_UABAM|nr:FAD:protein FMN transferase [Candidatus Uabimicrobium amorphum]BBM85130.1 thiamin biosynthesis lipoprotein ApbE [Candidatus Uabimicrobium amorphum]
MRTIVQILIVVIAIIAWLLFPSKQYSPTIKGRALGTTYTIKIAHVISKAKLVEIRETVRKELEDINNKMSTYLSDSELSKFNQLHSIEPFPISQKTLQVIIEAQTVSQASNGAFDITVGPLVNLWGFGPQKIKNNPSAQKIKDMLQQVGYQKLTVDPQSKTLKKAHPDLYVDLSAIAKGFAVDAVCDCLRNAGMQNYMVEIGGEIRASAFKKDKTPWIIGIESPQPGKRSVQKAVTLKGMAIATSGNYRNFRYDAKTKKRLSHTISPQTGRPISHNLASVSVISSTCMHADAMATALMVLGEKRGFELAQSLKLACYFIVHEKPGNYKILQTDAFKKLQMK